MAACTRTVNLQTCSTAVVSSSSARASSGVRLAKPASRVVFSRRSRAVCSATAEPEAAKATTYSFIIANAKFMLKDEEHMVEVLRERKRVFQEKEMERDFWVVPEPAFLDAMPEVSKRVARPCVAIVSTNENWITFMKLRMDRVLKGQFEAEGDVEEVLKSNPFTLDNLDTIAATPEFRPPPGPDREKGWADAWSAPYDMYDEDWWKSFVPGADA